MPIPEPPLTEEKILAYAVERGLQNALLKYRPLFGWQLYGTGRDSEGRPLVWTIVQELGVDWGCGGPDYHQVNWRPQESF